MNKEKNFILYSLPNCPMCKILKEKLKANKIEYQTIENEEILKKEGITEVPVLIINNEKYNFNDAMYVLKEVNNE